MAVQSDKTLLVTSDMFSHNCNDEPSRLQEMLKCFKEGKENKIQFNKYIK